MNKQELLEEIKRQSREGGLRKDEVLSAMEGERGAGGAEPHSRISSILSYIGGAIVFIGIAILIGQNWEQLNDVTKVIATLGSGVALFASGTILFNRTDFQGVGNALHLVSALVLPVGLFVTLNVFDVLFTLGVQTAVFTLLFAMYLAMMFAMRGKSIFALFSVVFGTIFFFSLTNQLVVNSGFSRQGLLEFSEYRVLLTGFTYMLLGYALVQKRMYAVLSPWLYSVGALGFLGSALALGGWSPNQNVFWELIFPVLVFGLIYLSVQVKSTSFLILGSLFLIAYIFKITAEYFTDSIGWPLALVILGFVLIGVGYLTVYLKKKYISR